MELSELLAQRVENRPPLNAPEATRGRTMFSNANLWIRTGRFAQFRNHIRSSAFQF
jgi:hypothetical protein